MGGETRPLKPHTPRAQRRVHAEAQVRLFGRATGTRVHLLRIPGIYAPDREGGTPRGRLLKGTPVLRAKTTSTPTTSTPTTWPAPAWRPCGAASRSAPATPATTRS
jgi:hypothetical protein